LSMSREGSGGRLLNGRANSGTSPRKKMSGDHPRNTAPMLASLRCGAKTRDVMCFASCQRHVPNFLCPAAALMPSAGSNSEN
jgi:hypothetical protein